MKLCRFTLKLKLNLSGYHSTNSNSAPSGKTTKEPSQSFENKIQTSKNRRKKKYVHIILSFPFENSWFCLLAGDPLPQLCPPGHYCDGVPGGDFSGAAGPRPCPLHTYRAAAGAGSKAHCLSCPPGWHCDSTGLTQCTTSLPFLLAETVSRLIYPLFYSNLSPRCWKRGCEIRLAAYGCFW